MSERFKNSQFENAKLRDEIKRLKGALREINCGDKKNVVLRPRRELFKEEKVDKQLGFELPKMMIFRNMYAGLTDREEYVFRGSFGQTYEGTIEDLKYYPAASKENERAILSQRSKPPNTDRSEGTVLNQQSKPQDIDRDEGTILDQQSRPPHIDRSDKKITLNTEEKPKNTEHTLYSPPIVQHPISIKDSFGSFYNEGSTIPIFDISSPKLEKIPENHPNTALQASSQSILLQIQSLREENLKLRQKLKNPPPKPSITKQHSSSPRPRTPLNQVPTTHSKQSLTPRQKHCPMCDHLLSKGYSTVLCSKHNFS